MVRITFLPAIHNGVIAGLIIFFIIYFWYKFRNSRKKIYQLLQIIPVILLLLVCINPEIKVKTDKLAKQKIMLLLDSSESMQIRYDKSETRMKKAREKMAEVENFLKKNMSGDILISRKMFGNELLDFSSENKYYPNSGILNVLSDIKILDDDRLKSIFVFTDGNFKNFNYSDEFVNILKQKKKKVSIFYIKNPSDKETDIAVEVEDYPKSIFQNKEFVIKIKVTGKNVPVDKFIPLVLRKNGVTIEKRNLSFSDREIVNISFKLKADNIGENIFNVNVPAIDEEKNVLNNSRTFLINFDEKKYKILVVCGEIDWDYTFFKRELIKPESFDITYVYPYTPENEVKPGKYNLVILFKPDFSNIADPVKDIIKNNILNYKSSVFVCIDKNFYNQAFLPEFFKLDSIKKPDIEGEFKVEPAEKKIQELIPQGEWDKLPPLQEITKIKVNNGFDVLLRTDPLNAPLLTLRRIKDQNLIMFAGTGFYKWLFTAKSYDMDIGFVYDFWKNILFYCLKQKVEQKFTMYLKNSANPKFINDPVNIDINSEQVNKKVKIEISKDSKVLHEFNKMLTAEKKMEVSFIPGSYGVYRVKAGLDNDEEFKVIQIVVEPNPDELKDFHYLKNKLTEITKITGGDFFSVNDKYKIPETEYKELKPEVVYKKFSFVGNYYYVFLFLLVYCAVWLLFKIKSL